MNSILDNSKLGSGIINQKKIEFFLVKNLKELKLTRVIDVA